MTTTEEYQVEALRRALDIARTNAEQAKDEPFRPWRDDPGEKTENVRAAREAVHAIESQIIDLEYRQRDPEQDMELRAELYAEMALSGVRDDVSLYMHTPMEEELFQQQILHQVQHGYYDDDGHWNEGLDEGAPHMGSCGLCGAILWEDDALNVNGHYSCDTCEPDIRALFIILCLIFPDLYLSEGRWGEWSIQRAGEGGGR